MAATIKVLGQLKPAAATLSTLYTAPTAAVISSITVCNLGASPDVFRIAIRPAGEAINEKHYLYYDVYISNNDTFIATVGLTLAATDVVSVYSTNGTTAFNLFGQENT